MMNILPGPKCQIVGHILSSTTNIPATNNIMKEMTPSCNEEYDKSVKKDSFPSGS